MRLVLLISVSFIFAIGLMMVFNTSSAEILDRSLDLNLHEALIRQLIYATIGSLFGIAIWKIGYEDLLKFSFPLLIFGCFLLLLVFVPGISHARNGAHRWIGLGHFTFQPSELVKYFIPMAFIEAILNRKEEKITLVSFLKIMGVLSLPLFLVMVEPDNGTCAVMGASLLPLFFLSKVPFKYFGLPFLILLVVMGAVAYNLPYVKARLQVYLHPELDLKGKGHQPHQAKIAAGSGKLFGRGAGASLQKFTYLPEAQNDYIAAIFAEEFGFIGILILVVLYMLFCFGGFSIALQAKSPRGAYLATAITFLIALQAFLNLGVASGLLPSKGVNLPFFSQGGTSLVANILGLVILLNIGKKNEIAPKKNYS